MKRSFERIGTSDDAYVRQTRKCRARFCSSMRGSCCTPSTTSSSTNSDPATTTDGEDAGPLGGTADRDTGDGGVLLPLVVLPPRSSDLDKLREDGVVRHILGFLDVRDHQVVRACCRKWRHLVQTLALDLLALQCGSQDRHPVVHALNLDRVFLAVIHN